MFTHPTPGHTGADVCTVITLHASDDIYHVLQTLRHPLKGLRAPLSTGRQQGSVHDILKAFSHSALQSRGASRMHPRAAHLLGLTS